MIQTKLLTIIIFTESSQAAKYGGCFSASSTVQTSTGERRQLSDLQVGEKVLSVDSTTKSFVYSEVLMFLDWDPLQRREFLKFELASGRTLTVTPSHLLMTGSANSSSTVYAGKLDVGSKLLVSDSRNNLVEDAIVKVTLILDTGVIAPLTAAGTIVVDDVVASCYAVIDSQVIAHWAFVPVRIYSNLKEGVRRMWNLIESPISAWAGNSKTLSKGSLISKTSAENSYRTKSFSSPTIGVHWYARILYTIADYTMFSHLYR